MLQVENVSDFYWSSEGFSHDPEFCDWCLGQAVQALIDDGKEETAALLMSCVITWKASSEQSALSGTWELRYKVTISGPIGIIRQLDKQQGQNKHGYECLIESSHLTAFDEMLRLVLGKNFGQPEYDFQIKAAELPSSWRTELLEIARKKGTTNQGLVNSSSKCVNYANLRFRSASEVRIAQAFDRTEVMYYPNCMGRVNFEGHP